MSDASVSKKRQKSSACPMCPRRFCRCQKAQFKRHVESHGLGCDSEPEEEESSGAGREAAGQLESSDESAMRPAGVKPTQQVIGGSVRGGSPVRREQNGSNESSVSSGLGAGAAVQRRHRCGECGKCFVRKDDLRQHFRVHSGERPFQCEICSKRFSRSCKLTGHIAAVHRNERPHKCGTCAKCFATAAHLREHSRTHSNEKPLECKVCGRGFSHSCSLTVHVRVHTGEKPFVCKVCDKGFSKSSNLTDHVTVHTGEKPFVCKVCGKRFSHSGSLSCHVRVHTDERPFVCTECGKRFRQSSHLTKHSRGH